MSRGLEFMGYDFAKQTWTTEPIAPRDMIPRPNGQYAVLGALGLFDSLVALGKDEDEAAIEVLSKIAGWGTANE